MTHVVDWRCQAGFRVRAGAAGLAAFAPLHLAGRGIRAERPVERENRWLGPARTWAMKIERVVHLTTFADEDRNRLACVTGCHGLPRSVWRR